MAANSLAVLYSSVTLFNVYKNANALCSKYSNELVNYGEYLKKTYPTKEESAK
jgi:hypothetical protein